MIHLTHPSGTIRVSPFALLRIEAPTEAGRSGAHVWITETGMTGQTMRLYVNEPPEEVETLWRTALAHWIGRLGAAIADGLYRERIGKPRDAERSRA